MLVLITIIIVILHAAGALAMYTAVPPDDSDVKWQWFVACLTWEPIILWVLGSAIVFMIKEKIK